MRSGSSYGEATGAEWSAFISKLEAAEVEFARGRPADFKALWSHTDDVTIMGAFGGIVAGWSNITTRLDWASSYFADGRRTRDEVHVSVGADIAYLVQRERIDYRAGNKEKTHELRVTMVVRRTADGWRIVHRHADPMITPQAPK